MSHPRVKTLLTILALTAAAGSLAAASSGDQIDEKKIEGITASVSSSVVKVEARNGVRKVATGVIIDKDGSIVTTALISPRDEEISVFTFEGKKFKAEFKGFDTQSGLAVIQVKEKNLKPVVFGKSSDVRPGAWAGAIGFSPENTPAVTQGIVSSLSEDRIRLNLWVMPGLSGGPVVNSEGRLIGVLRGTYVDEQPVVFEFRDQQVIGSGTVLSRAEAPSSGMAVAVPVDVVLSVAGDIRKDGKVQRGWIGITVKEADGRLEIYEITPHSPAELAKIKEGDIIQKIEGTDVTSGAVFSREIRKRKPGTDVRLVLERDGATREVKVRLGEYTEEDGRRELESRFPGLFFPRPDQTKPGTVPRELERFFKFENRKYIGVTLQPLTRNLAEFFGSKEGRGLLVTEFDEDSPAEKAGMKIGDVILKADGRIVEDVPELSDMLQKKNKGDRIRFDLLRDKKSLTIDVPVGEQEVRFPKSLSDRGLLEQFLKNWNDPRIVVPRPDSSKKSLGELLDHYSPGTPDKTKDLLSGVLTSTGDHYRILISVHRIIRAGPPCGGTAFLYGLTSPSYSEKMGRGDFP